VALDGVGVQRGHVIDTHLPFRTGTGLAAAEAREVERLLAHGLLVPVLLDVVVAADAPADLALRARALQLVVPDRLHDRGAAVAQEAAAWLWCGGAPPAVVDVAVMPGGGRVPAPYLAVHEWRMTPDDVTFVEFTDARPLAVTTVVRTAADLLRVLPTPYGLGAAVHVATVAGVTAGEVTACLERMPRARGVARARRLLGDWPGQPRHAEHD
jgi:hypothetical protein